MTIQLYNEQHQFKWSGVEQLFANAVVEVVFGRRNPVKRLPLTRRMLCTTNWSLLNSIPGNATLHFRSPSGPPPYNASQYNLITVWDILYQDFRNINLDGFSESNILAVMPTRNKEEIIAFWQYFADNILNMSAAQKMKFMGMR